MTRTTTKPTAREQLRTMRAESLATAEQLELIAAEHAKECAAWGDIPGYMHTIRHGRLMIKALAKSAERLAAKFRSASARLPARREPSAGSRSYPPQLSGALGRPLERPVRPGDRCATISKFLCSPSCVTRRQRTRRAL